MSFHSNLGGPGGIRFSRSCPTCGMRIRLQSQQLGRQVACPHCLAEFQASLQDDDQSVAIPGPSNPATRDLMERVDSVLEQVALEQAALRATYTPVNSSY